MSFPVWVPITVRYPTKCGACGARLAKGDRAYWKKGSRVRCEACRP